MPTTAPAATITVALLGNPNTGKSTLFTALAGVHQRTGNYPGVTVEKKLGHAEFDGSHFTLVDLPGTYSLAPRSLDEMVTVDVLLGRRNDTATPDAVLCIVDASNLERNLYLVSQVLELGLPTVVALNMTDIAADRGVRIDRQQLEERLGVPVVEVQAHRRQGIEALKQKLADAARSPISRDVKSPFPPAFVAEVYALEVALAAQSTSLPRYLVERLLLDTGGYLEQAGLAQLGGDMRAQLDAARQRLRAAGLPVPAVEAMARYGWVEQVLDRVVTRPTERRETTSDRIDRVLTNRFSGTLFFLMLMIVVFSSIFTLAAWPMAGVEAVIGWLGDWAGGLMAEGPLRSLLVNGVISGVGAVLVFLPQILILFFFVAVLEDCGYMARAAYLMDRLMSRVGLSGKSFIPLLSSFACAIPGIMATRVIENRRDRFTTIMVAPLMSCAARLPVYSLLIAAFIPSIVYFRLGSGEWSLFSINLQGLVLLAMYLIGMLTAIVVALLLKKTLLRGPTPPFVMELPAYKWPSPRVVGYRVYDRGAAFIKRAGTLIFAVTVLVWAASYYPHDTEAVEGPFAAEKARVEAELAAVTPQDEKAVALQEELADINHQIDGEYQRRSYLGQAGHWIEPVVRPLGWDWRIGSAAIASFPAREVVIGSLGVIYNLGGDEDEESVPLRQKLREATWDGTDRKVYNVPVALSIMVFFALCAQCGATLVIIRRETNSWRWPIFTFVYMTVLAYIAALATYQIGMQFIGGA